MILAAANQLTSPDYPVIAAYLLGTIGLGLYIGRRMKTGTDFFLGGRRLPWWAIGMSLVATDIGGTDIIAVPGLIAVATFPDLEDGDQAFPRLVGELLPTGLRGLFVRPFWLR